MHSHLYRWAAVSAVVAALFLAATAPPAWATDVGDDDRGAPVVPLKDARLKIEMNSTDRDVGVQLFIDGDQWKSIDLYDPQGRLIFRATTRGSMAKQGGTELFIESAEPSLDDVPLEVFLKRFPAGDYRIVGRGINGEKLVGVAKFTHNIPAGPVLVSPVEDAVVDLNNLVVRWQAVGPANGSPIIGYQVLVVKPNTGIRALPKVILDVMMPASATSMAVPPGFLLPDSAYEWEILAIESGGNQTLSVGHFRTPK
jgi:hypothetical protein